uniref:Protein kinase domain-containing protein n=1 Tax=Caenorhabditis japonica TaxID=281687 RepID=A0A8R1ETB0_CAEJA
MKTQFKSAFTVLSASLQISLFFAWSHTNNWMAPEMIKKEPCNEKVDVYSFGVVLWEMLTRETPYVNIDQMAIIFGVGTK